MIDHFRHSIRFLLQKATTPLRVLEVLMKTRSRAYALVAAICTLLAWFLADTTLMRILDDRLLDFYFYRRGDRKPLPTIVIVAIDNKTLHKIGWPFSHNYHSRLLDKLRIGGAKVVGFDLMFGEVYEGDAEFAQALPSSGGHLPVVLAVWQEYIFHETSTGAVMDKESRLPIELLRERASALGHVLLPNNDPVVRRCQPWIQHSERDVFGTVGVWAFGVMLAALANNVGPDELIVHPDRLIFGDGTFQLDDDGMLLINYAGNQGSFRRVSYINALDMKDDELRRAFKDTVVLVGTNLPLYDIYNVPPGKMWGVEIQANIVNTLLNPQFHLNSPSRWSGLSYAIIAVLLTTMLLYHLGLTRWILLGLGSGVGLLVLVIWLFPSFHLVVHISDVCLGTVLTSVILVVYENAHVRGVLERMVGRKAADKFSDLEKGHKFDSTVFFCDIRGYTPISEHADPHALRNLVNEYLTMIAQVLNTHGGEIEYYQGDAVIGLFRATRREPNYALAALRAAVVAQEGMIQLCDKWKRQFKPPLEIGIGLATGEVELGTIGGAEKMQVTVLGDPVNIASRVQGLTKQLGNDILMTSNTYKRVRAYAKAQNLGAHQVKGRERAVEILGFMGWRVEGNLEYRLINDLRARSILELAGMMEKLSWITDDLSKPPAKLVAIRSSIDRVINHVRQYLALDSTYRKDEALSRAVKEVETLQHSFIAARGHFAPRLLQVMNEWLRLLEAELEIIWAQAEAMQEIRNPFVVGNPVAETEHNVFTGRRDIVRRIEEIVLGAVQTPTLLLYGSRRMGKTSILNQLPRLLGPDFAHAILDCQHPTVTSNVTTLLRYISRALSDGLRQRRVTVEPLTAEALEREPFAAFDEWLDGVERTMPEKMRTLLCLDEYERLQTTLDAGWDGNFLDFLRHTLQHRPRVVLMFTGAHTFEELGPMWTDRFISARRVRVSFLKRDEVIPLLTQPIPVPEFDMTYASGALDAIITATNCQPFLTQAVAFELVQLLNQQQRKDATPNDVEEAIARALVSGGEYFANVWSDAGEEGQAILGAIVKGETPPDFPKARTWLREHDVLNDEGKFAVPMVERWVKEKTKLI